MSYLPPIKEPETTIDVTPSLVHQGTGKAKDNTKSTAGEAPKLRKRRLLPGVKWGPVEVGVL